MINSHSIFLNKFKEYYPEIYLKVIEFPDPFVVGWINEISQYKEMITLENPQKVKEYFEMKVAMYNGFLQKKNR